MTDISDVQSIATDLTGRPMNPMETINQLGLWTRARIGMINSSLMRAETYIKFQVACGGRRRKWVTIKLASNDTYSVEFAHTQRLDYIIDLQRHGIYVDQLAHVVEQMYQEVYA